MFKSLILALSAFLLPQGQQMANHTVTYRAAVPTSNVYTSADFTVPQFDPALGTLNKVEVWVDFTLDKTDVVEVLSDQPVNLCADFDASGSEYDISIGLPAPLYTFLSNETVLTTPETLCADGPFDGTDDFMGPSSFTGATRSFVHVGTPYSYLYTDFSYFTGTGTAPLMAYFSGISYVNAPANIDWTVLSAIFKKCVVKIRYTYV